MLIAPLPLHSACPTHRSPLPQSTSNDEITIFDSTGTAIQDVAAAVLVYKRARKLGVVQ
jgi:Predicted ornithine cyclodeaminase, mu-crystallin homolog